MTHGDYVTTENTTQTWPCEHKNLSSSERLYQHDGDKSRFHARTSNVQLITEMLTNCSNQMQFQNRIREHQMR